MGGVQNSPGVESQMWAQGEAEEKLRASQRPPRVHSPVAVGARSSPACSVFPGPWEPPVPPARRPRKGQSEGCWRRGALGRGRRRARRARSPAEAGAAQAAAGAARARREGENKERVRGGPRLGSRRPRRGWAGE